MGAIDIPGGARVRTFTPPPDGFDSAQIMGTYGGNAARLL